MTKDPAFLWETEAVREASERRPDRAAPSNDDWATLRDASVATGVPTKVIRKWAKREVIPSFLDEDTNLRMVSVSAVRARDTRPKPQAGPIPEAAVTPAPAEPDEEEAAAEEEAAPEEPEPPEGTMLVPIAAWDKMLMQLSNLHEAGQQLAEARERAGRAETEAQFLRERMAELRQELQAAQATPTSPPPPEPSAARTPEEAAPHQESQPIWEYVYTRWQRRRRS